jgi:hypothetical protein
LWQERERERERERENAVQLNCNIIFVIDMGCINVSWHIRTFTIYFYDNYYAALEAATTMAITLHFEALSCFASND